MSPHAPRPVSSPGHAGPPPSSAPPPRRSTTLSSADLEKMLSDIESLSVDSWRRSRAPDSTLFAEYRISLRLASQLLPVNQWWRFSDLRNLYERFEELNRSASINISSILDLFPPRTLFSNITNEFLNQRQNQLDLFLK